MYVVASEKQIEKKNEKQINNYEKITERRNIFNGRRWIGLTKS